MVPHTQFWQAKTPVELLFIPWSTSGTILRIRQGKSRPFLYMKVDRFLVF